MRPLSMEHAQAEKGLDLRLLWLESNVGSELVNTEGPA